MAYEYVVFDNQGKRLKGQIEAPSESAAEEMLWGQQYTIISLAEATERAEIQLFASRIKTRDLIVFSRQLATLIESGIPIVRALHLLNSQMSNKRFANILQQVTADVQQGRFFSEAIAKHGKVFPDLYARMLEIGERSGNLESVLRQLASYLEKEEELVRKVKGAMSYPAFVLVLAIGVLFLMVIVALPPLMNMFTVFNAELPLPTRILISITDFMAVYKFHVLGGIAGVALAFYLVFIKTESGRVLLDGFLLRVPLIGRIIIQGTVARMCRSVSSLLNAGIALPEILQMVIRTQSNRVLRKHLEDVHSELLQGHGLADPLGQRDVFPRMLVQMVRVGEETGSLDSNMHTLAEFYESEVDRSVSALTAAMEPALTIFIGLVVGFVAVAVIMPMYSLMGSIE
jgi:type IV pilus assembly protein PilC